VCEFTFIIGVNTLASGYLRVNTQMKLNNNSGKKKRGSCWDPIKINRRWH